MAAAAEREVDYAGPLFRGRVRLGIGAGGMIFFDSAYRRAREVWGFDPYQAASGLIAEIGVAVADRVVVGARGGRLFGDGGQDDRGNHESLAVWDAGAFARWSPFVGQSAPGRWLRFGVQLEAGAAYAAIDFREARNARTLVRFAGLAVGEVSFGPVALQARLGAQFLQWPDAGGAGFDLSLSGVTMYAMLEARP